jgi:SnoaL-like protein
MLAFRRAVESRNFERIGELLADDVVLHSPVAFKPYYGRDTVIGIINSVSAILEDFAYQRHLGTETGTDHALVFDARVGELSIQGCDFLHTNADGLIDELTVMLRPLKVVLAFTDQMTPKLAAAMEAVVDSQATG